MFSLFFARRIQSTTEQLIRLCNPVVGLYDIDYGFGAKIDRSLIAGFLAPIGAAGPDYLEVNLCETGEL